MEPNHLLCQGLMWAGTDAADPGASANWGYRRHRTLAGESACPTGGHNPGWRTLAGESACPTGGHNAGWRTLAGESACPTGGHNPGWRTLAGESACPTYWGQAWSIGGILLGIAEGATIIDRRINRLKGTGGPWTVVGERLSRSRPPGGRGWSRR